MKDWFYVIFFVWLMLGFTIYLINKGLNNILSKITKLEEELKLFNNLKKKLLHKGLKKGGLI